MPQVGGESCLRMLTRRWDLCTDLEATPFQLDSHPFLNFPNGPAAPGPIQLPIQPNRKATFPSHRLSWNLGGTRESATWAHRKSGLVTGKVAVPSPRSLSRSFQSLATVVYIFFGQSGRAGPSLTGKPLSVPGLERPWDLHSCQ